MSETFNGSQVKLDYQERKGRISKMNLSVNDGDKIPWDRPIPLGDTVCINGVWFEKAIDQQRFEKEWNSIPEQVKAEPV